jgi:hypothetical protein
MICWAQGCQIYIYSENDSLQDSTRDSSNDSTQGSTEATSGNSEKVKSSLVVAGVVITVVGVTISIRVAIAKKAMTLGLQDQIYLAEGKEHRDLLNFFELNDKGLIKANDELVAAGYQIASDQEAADYLVALIRKLAERSQKIPYQLSVL